MLLKFFGKTQQPHDVVLQRDFPTKKSDSILRTPSEDTIPVPSSSAVVQGHQSKMGHTG